MNELQTFANNEFGAVRSMMIDDVPRFVGRDVAVALGYSNPRKTVGAHVDDEDKNKNTVTIRDGIQGGGKPNMTIINESGLYSLIFSSKLPPLSATQDEVPPRELTSDGYFRAASIMATCKNERFSGIR